LVLVPTLASALVLAVVTVQGERQRNDLIRRYAIEQIDGLVESLEVETRDWATWDDSYRHAIGRNPGYYASGYTADSFQRTPLVMVLDHRGRVVSSARWNPRLQKAEPLPEPLRQQLLRALPDPGLLRPRTVLAMLGDQPHLLSAQLISNSQGSVPPVGRLLFVRPLRGDSSANTRNALALQDFRIEPVRELRSGPLGPLALTIRNPRWDSVKPLQIAVLRPASERQLALLALLLLLLVDAVLLLLLHLRAYRLQRLQRRLLCQQRREQQRLQRALHRSENLDALTGLLNDRGLLTAIERRRREQPQAERALLLLDIRHFGLINSSYGRRFGDQVLRHFALWLRQQLQGSGIVSRSGGDDFTCALFAESTAELRAQISLLMAGIEALELQVEHRTLGLSVSAGARILTDSSSEKALHETAVARDLAKISGRHACQFYGDELAGLQNYVGIQRLNQQLILALKNDHIAFFGQPAWRLSDPGLPLVYIEFLARIHNPDDNSYRWSEALVEAATYCGTMPLLDRHVLTHGCSLLQAFLGRNRRQGEAAAVVHAFNITPDTLLADGFVRDILSLLERHDLPPDRLCLEITEQAAIRNLQGLRSVIASLRAHGIRFALDDFGSGMTSLSQLRDLPLDYVKVDKSFIARLREDATSRLTVQFMVQLGDSLGFEVIAEGVEDRQLLWELQELGVDLVQGHITAVPCLLDPQQPAEAFTLNGDASLRAALERWQQR
ncbi:MAG: bifunctional diguanylate cyclase/phosphodiesterase, partial [Synechococcaceae cyanobacterium]|nr:bifunctional diguanylate cyclase/phosphodiesterase [Synechococcaceae cyanobacterium]